MAGKIALSVSGLIRMMGINMSSTESDRIILKNKIRNRTCDNCNKRRISGLNEENGEYGYSCAQWMGGAGWQNMPVPEERTCEEWEQKDKIT